MLNAGDQGAGLPGTGAGLYEERRALMLRRGLLRIVEAGAITGRGFDRLIRNQVRKEQRRGQLLVHQPNGNSQISGNFRGGMSLCDKEPARLCARQQKLTAEDVCIALTQFLRAVGLDSSQTKWTAFLGHPGIGTARHDRRIGRRLDPEMAKFVRLNEGSHVGGEQIGQIDGLRRPMQRAIAAAQLGQVRRQ